MSTQKSRNLWLDLFRFVLVFLVINIHFNQDSFFMPIFRMAVPMFFMISGYFAYSPAEEEQNKKNARLIKGSLRYLIIACIIYFVFDMISIAIAASTGKVETFMQSLFLMGGGTSTVICVSYGHHLWFLLSLLIVNCIHYLICKKSLTKIYKYLIPVLIILALFLNGYIKLLGVEVPLMITRNSIFTGLPMFAIGFLAKKHSLTIHSTWIKASILFLSVFTLCLSLLEAQIVVMEYYICSVISSFGFLLFFTSLQTKENKFSAWYYNYIGKNSTFNIYVYHVFIGIILKYFNLNLSPLLNCLIIFILSFALHIAVHLTTKAFKEKKSKKQPS